MLSIIICLLFVNTDIFCLIFQQNLEPTKKDTGKDPYPIIIEVSCGGIFVVAVLNIYLIRHCHRRKMTVDAIRA